MAKRKKLALIDAHALIHRAYHALPPMSAKGGIPTNAVYGFTAMLFKMFSTLKPTHVIAAFDMEGPTFREKIYEDYKAHREGPPDDLVQQFDLVRDVLQAFGIPIIQKKGYEADDIIGTLVEKINGDVKKVIVTGDLDTLQLIDDTTSVFTLKRGITDTVLYDEHMVQEKFGFGPEYVVDYKGLRGDPTDNIPGVQGIGDKTARDLVGEYGSIEEVYKHLKDTPSRAQTRLKGHKKDALLSKRLATIKRNVPVSFSIDDAVMKGYDTQKVRKALADLGFKSLLQRLPEGGTAVQPTLFQREEIRSGKTDDGKAVKEASVFPALPDNYHIIEDEQGEQNLRKLLKKADIMAFDTETDYLGAREYPIVGMSFALRSNATPRSSEPHGVQSEVGAGSIQAYYIPVDPESVKKWKDVLEDPNIKKTGHNLKYDIEVLMQSDIHLKGIVFDSMIASYLLSPGSRQHSLDALALSELDYHTIPLTDLIGEKEKGKLYNDSEQYEQKLLSKVPLQDIARYACEDADVALQLYDALVPRIKEEGLTRVLEEIEVPLVPVLAVMELNGVAVDRKVLKDLQKSVTARISRLEQKIIQEAGEEFNVNSTQQLRVVLFEKLKLPTAQIRRTQTGYSTASSELEKLHDEHPIVPLIEEYRELSKLLNTYIVSLFELVDSDTGRIYTSFNQTITATGRLSSADPNLQNIPVRTQLGQQIRKAFIAERGKRLVVADYSQIELRLAAHMSQDEKMIDVFRAGGDIHKATAAFVFGIDPEHVTPTQRREAKTLNFGVLYGMGAQSFARSSGISVEEARSFIGRYFEQYSRLAEYIALTIEQARDFEYTETLFGRRRYIPEINSGNPAISSQAERMAFNFPLQGTAADILKKAMIALQEIIETDFPDVRMVLTVHDELVCEAPQKQVRKLAGTMKEVMEKVTILDVPLVVDVGIGKNWKEMKKLRN